MKTPALILLTASLHAQTLTPLRDSDVYAYLDQPTSSTFSLGVSASGPGAPHSQHSVVQFDLSGIALAADQLGSATLRLFVLAPDSAFGDLGAGDVEVFRQGAAWTVDTLRWNSLQPEAYQGAFPITTDSIDSWVEFDLTPLVREWLSGAQPNYGILLRPATEDPAELNVTFASMEFPGFSPQLVLTERKQEPTLSISQENGEMVLRWPADTTWTLEQSTEFRAWSSVTAAPTIIDGVASHTVMPGPTPTFFRLNSDPE
ncbi:DNRLRE domain-containing protein [Haloferula sargassicola]|uniref:Carbohydrate-binding module family 96 domain-containing protein n=1 Tax=Haloferula sargassicola TaxID=490096 RepID=A0ABP9UQU7_9BACT